MPDCDVGDCDGEAVAGILGEADPLRCAECLEFDAKTRGWWE